MKKSILIGIFISVVITASAYYYFFIMTAKDESQVLPSKVKIAIKLSQTTEEKSSEKIKPKEEKQKEDKKSDAAKKQEQTVVENKKEETKSVEKKVDVKKEEPQKAEIKKDESKTAKKDVKDISKVKPQKILAGYRLEYIVASDEEATKIREQLVENGYHTAKKVIIDKRHYVLIAPFTDKWEAEYVKNNILKETKINFVVKPVYR